MQLISEQQFTGDESLPKAEFEACEFTDGNWPNSFLDNRIFLECSFYNCDLSNANLAHTRLQEMYFEDCKLSGIDFSTLDSFLLQVHFKNCILHACNFEGLDLRTSKFEACRLQRSEFTACDLRQLSFANCDLEGVRFSDCKLGSTDFTAAVNFSLDPARNQVKKMKLRQEQLAGLLEKYDLDIE